MAAIGLVLVPVGLVGAVRLGKPDSLVGPRLRREEEGPRRGALRRARREEAEPEKAEPAAQPPEAGAG